MRFQSFPQDEFLAEMSTFSLPSRQSKILRQLFFCLLGCDKEKKKKIKSDARILPDWPGEPPAQTEQQQ